MYELYQGPFAQYEPLGRYNGFHLRSSPFHIHDHGYPHFHNKGKHLAPSSYNHNSGKRGSSYSYGASTKHHSLDTLEPTRTVYTPPSVQSHVDSEIILLVRHAPKPHGQQREDAERRDLSSSFYDKDPLYQQSLFREVEYLYNGVSTQQVHTYLVSHCNSFPSRV